MYFQRPWNSEHVALSTRSLFTADALTIEANCPAPVDVLDRAVSGGNPEIGEDATYEHAHQHLHRIGIKACADRVGSMLLSSGGAHNAKLTGPIA